VFHYSGVCNSYDLQSIEATLLKLNFPLQAQQVSKIKK
jgi:hypothetical protein